MNAGVTVLLTRTGAVPVLRAGDSRRSPGGRLRRSPTISPRSTPRSMRSACELGGAGGHPADQLVIDCLGFHRRPPGTGDGCPTHQRQVRSASVPFLSGNPVAPPATRRDPSASPCFSALSRPDRRRIGPELLKERRRASPAGAGAAWTAQYTEVFVGAAPGAGHQRRQQVGAAGADFADVRHRSAALTWSPRRLAPRVIAAVGTGWRAGDNLRCSRSANSSR